MWFGRSGGGASVQIKPPQLKNLSFQQFLRTPQPSELTIFESSVKADAERLEIIMGKIVSSLLVIRQELRANGNRAFQLPTKAHVSDNALICRGKGKAFTG